jgi:hypothetical protein
VNSPLHTPLRAYSSSGDTVLLILTLTTRWSWVLRVTPLEKSPGKHRIRGYVGHRIGMDFSKKKKYLAPTRIRTQNRPARSLEYYTDYRPQIMRWIPRDGRRVCGAVRRNWYCRTVAGRKDSFSSTGTYKLRTWSISSRIQWSKALRAGKNNSSIAVKSCACAFISFLAGIIFCLWTEA